MKIGWLILALAVLGPIAVVGYGLRRVANRRRALAIAAVAGAVMITPLALLLALGAYAGVEFFLGAWIAGALYGLLIAAVALGLRGTPFADRDRSD